MNPAPDLGVMGIGEKYIFGQFGQSDHQDVVTS